MIRVRININDRVIHDTYAVNVTQDFGGDYGIGEQTYECDDIEIGTFDSLHSAENKRIIKHDFNKGAIELSIKMLQELLKQENQDR